jgi:mersacidin/lichenicidin family type 2 lantibiotic
MSDKIAGTNLTREDLIRAWKDADYRDSLNPRDVAVIMNMSDEERKALLFPTGEMELTDEELAEVAGGLADNSASCWRSSCNA